MRSGWVSDRTVCYLASGRPVLIEDTGLGACLPLGEGCVTFSDPESALAGLDRINGSYERQRRAEKRVKTIYVHAHMDEDTFEVGRAMRCPDQVPVHAERLVGACAYNLHHRQRDARFWVQHD